MKRITGTYFGKGYEYEWGFFVLIRTSRTELMMRVDSSDIDFPDDIEVGTIVHVCSAKPFQRFAYGKYYSEFADCEISILGGLSCISMSV